MNARPVPARYGILDANVQDVLLRCADSLPAFRIAIVRCLDSERDTQRLLTFLKRENVVVETCGSVLCIDQDTLRSLAERDGVLVGFDEIWLVNQHSHLEKVNLVEPLTSDAVLFSEAVPPQLCPTMEELDCPLVLADGCGLNYATTDNRFADALVREYPPLDPRPIE